MIYYLAGDRGLVGRNYKDFLLNNRISVRGGNTNTTDYTHYQQTHVSINIF